MRRRHNERDLLDPAKGGSSIYVVHLIQQMRNYQNGNIQTKTKVLRDIQQGVYTGGLVIEQYIKKDPRIIEICLKAIDEAEPMALRIQATKLLGVFCHGQSPLLEALFDLNVMERLVELLDSKNLTLKMWSLHAMFLLSVKNWERYKKKVVSELTNADWTGFGSNEADSSESPYNRRAVGMY
ncbi:hypothetical protein HDV01_005625 [Terramyces sp. JEL0728]|nr:hypothetical protein HDV01_005625 [Terramyces sp. JEL0728]